VRCPDGLAQLSGMSMSRESMGHHRDACAELSEGSSTPFERVEQLIGWCPGCTGARGTITFEPGRFEQLPGSGQAALPVLASVLAVTSINFSDRAAYYLSDLIEVFLNVSEHECRALFILALRKQGDDLEVLSMAQSA
jgi:hypothetical protein